MSTNPNPFGGSGFQAWQFHVAPLGGGADDTPNIRQAFISAGNYALNNQGYAQVVLDAALYTLSSPTVKGGVTGGNAQISLPNVAPTTPKITLDLTGYGGSAFPYFQSGDPIQTPNGTLLNATLTGQTNDATWGAPSVIGGPTTLATPFSNVLFRADGIMLMMPQNASYIGYDFRFMAQVACGRIGYDTNATIAQKLAAFPSNSSSVGLYMPLNGNNALSTVLDYQCQAAYYGLAFGEHFTIPRLTIAYTNIAMFANIGGGTVHGAFIGNAAIEVQQIVLQANGSGAGIMPVVIDRLDTESTNTRTIDDGNNNFYGRISWGQASGDTLIVNGGKNLKIINDNVGAGHLVSPPVVPASTVAATLVYRDATVVVHTGAGVTVSAITVDGTATSQTVAAASSSVPVAVPSGKTIALTYAGGTPTWDWWAT